MRKLSKTLLSLLLIAAMLASFVVLPAAAEEPAAEQPTEAVQAAETQSTAAVEGFDLSIVMLDCGRKYFSADSIKQIIDNASAAGFGYIMLGVGNDGMRFLLDDMSLTVNGTTYESDAVKSAIHVGNEAYYNFAVDELTQTEMDAVLAYAKEKGMGVIPMLNTPGHMDAILAAATSLTGTNCAYSGSARTIDVTNSTAVAFTQAFVQKYVDYFASKGCKYFNMGADEYANDMFTGGSMGFGNLQSTGKYSYYVEYVNAVAALIKNAGMTPMAFNDGIYFNNNTSSGTFDTDIVICYWSNGWSSYTPMPAETLASMGFKMVNTNGSYYWVLGKSDAQCSASKASGFSINSFPGSTIDNPFGAMFCIWADYPGAETEASVISKTADTIAAFGAKLPDTKDKVKWNTPVVKDNTVSDNGVSVAAPGLTKVTVTETGAPETLPEGVTEVKAWEIKPEIDGVPYEGEAKVTLKLPAEWVGADIFGGVMEDGKVRLIKEVELDEEASTLTFTVPHFSTVLAAKANKTETIEVELGTPKTVEQLGNLMEGKVNPLLDDEIATVNGESKIDVKGETTRTLGDKVKATTTNVVKGTYIISNGNGRYLMRDGSSVSSTTDILKATEWTLEKSNSGFTLFDGYYYLRNRDDDGNVNLNLVEPANASILDWNNDTNGLNTVIQRFIWDTTYYLKYSNNKWLINEGTRNVGALYKYTDTDTKDTYKTVLTITGNKAGTTTLTLGNTTYTIKVNYKTQQVSAVVGETTKVTNVSGNLYTEGLLDTSIATVAIANGTMTVTGVKEGNTSVRVGDTVYKISVSKGNLDTAPSLTIEYWITNKYVSEGTTYSESARSKSLAAATAHDEQGVLIADQVPSSGMNSDKNPVVYWKTTRLASDNKQTTGSGVDKTRSGNDFTYIRYWSGSWSYSTDRENWVNFEDGDQIVAYYLQKTTVTKEVETQVVDWGNQRDKWGELDYLRTKYVLMDYTVKYESGEQVPSTFPTADTLAFHCDTSTTKNNVYYREIGMIRAKETDEYEVYMITLTPTSDTPTDTLKGSTAAGNNSYEYKGTETVVWADTQEDLDASGLGTYTSISGTFTYSIGGEPIVPGVEIYRKQAMKVTYYVRTKTTEDSLTVHYIDKTANREFYSYNIAVAQGTYFNANIGLNKDAWKGPLVNGEVTNLKGNIQTVSADLSTLPALSAQYRYSDYTCVEVTRSTGNTETGTPAGKEVYLYYTFNNKHTFVVDFGVPLKIKATDIGVTVPEGDSYWTEATCTGAVYGETKIATGEGLIYTATKPMLGIETLNVTLATGTGEDDKATHTIYLVPATTVYYEQNVATYSTGWDTLGTIAPDKYQETQKGRTEGWNFGFDPYYEANQLGAGGSVKYTNTKGADATLTFKGTGMELYLRTLNANNTSNLNETDATNHSYMLVQVYAGDTADANNLKRMSFVDVNNLFVQHGTDKYGYNTPCWTVDGMAYGTYTVVVRYVKGTTYGLAIDGFRVTNTLNPDNATTKDFYAAVHEDNMQTSEIRNMVLKQAEVYNLADNWYKVGNEVIDAVYDAEDAARIINGAVLIKQNYDQNGGTDVQVTSDLVNIGPKNEIYLNPGEAVVMTVPTTYTTVQVGMRSLTGETVKYQINSELTKEMKSTVDMYYRVALADGGKLVIQNKSDSKQILALTKLKVTGAGTTTNDVSVETTPEAIRYAMALMRGIDVPQFTDVAEDAWYHDYVYDLVYRGVVNGMTATTYEPEGKLTRAQFVKLLACSLADAETLKTYEGKHPFKDSEGHWAEAYIAWAKDKGIVEGVSATEFDPEAPITREQMATIFGRYALKQGIELPKSENAAGSFPDAGKISEYAREFVELMRIAGILNGYEDGTFRPQGNATRAEAAKLFSLFLSITDKLAK
jgi:hypothetical protein